MFDADGAVDVAPGASAVLYSITVLAIAILERQGALAWPVELRCPQRWDLGVGAVEYRYDSSAVLLLDGRQGRRQVRARRRGGSEEALGGGFTAKGASRASGTMTAVFLYPSFFV